MKPIILVPTLRVTAIKLVRRSPNFSLDVRQYTERSGRQNRAPARQCKASKLKLGLQSIRHEGLNLMAVTLRVGTHTGAEQKHGAFINYGLHSHAERGNESKALEAML